MVNSISSDIVNGNLMIPAAKSAAVARALQETFGVAEFEDIRMLTAGLSSALIFTIVVAGHPYLLRVMVNNDAAPGPGQGDPTRQFACMRRGDEAGIAPRVWYTSVEDRISITDFVEARPLSRAEALARFPVTLKTLHGLEAFPLTINYLDFVDRFVGRFRAAKILPDSETAEIFHLYGRVVEAYRRLDSQLVSSHNDLKPENILFDGDRVWLVDWEAAFLNDRYFDLAVVANFIVTNDAEEEELLYGYFGEPAGELRMARFYLMRQLVHMSYAMVFMLLGSSGVPVEPDVKAPDFREFHDAIWAGEVSLAGDEMRLRYGRVHWSQISRNMRTERFHEALRIVGGRPASG